MRIELQVSRQVTHYSYAVARFWPHPQWPDPWWSKHRQYHSLGIIRELRRECRKGRHYLTNPFHNWGSCLTAFYLTQVQINVQGRYYITVRDFLLSPSQNLFLLFIKALVNSNLCQALGRLPHGLVRHHLILHGEFSTVLLLISTLCACEITGQWSAFQRWFWIENRTIFGEVMAIYVKSV